MKRFIGLIGSTIVWMVFIIFCAVLATFFITIFNADGVTRAVEVFKGILG